MELPELQQGLQNIQQAAVPPEAMPTAEAPWLNMDNLMQGYGNWFGNDQGLGELLLGQLRARGVDTQAATEAMLRELLQGLVDDLNMLQKQLTGFTSAIAQQMQQTQAVADSVQTAIDIQQPNTTATEITPQTSASMPVMNDMSPDMNFDMGEPATEQLPPEADTNEVTAKQPATEQLPPEADTNEVTAKQPVGTPSDRNIKYVLSDAIMKHINKAVSERKNNSKLNRNILKACQGGF